MVLSATGRELGIPFFERNHHYFVLRLFIRGVYICLLQWSGPGIVFMKHETLNMTQESSV